MPPIRITREVRQGWLSGNGIHCKCRVEIVTRTVPNLEPVTTLDIWIPQNPPEGDYKLQIDGTTFEMQFKRGVWLQAVA